MPTHVDPAGTSGRLEPASAISGPAVPHDEAQTQPSSEGLRRTFRDPALQAEFETFGFTVAPFLDGATIDRLRSIYDDVGPAPGDDRSGYFPGNVSESPRWKRTVMDAVTPLVEERVSQLLENHHAFHTTFMVKWPGASGALQIHSDPTMVADEGRFRSLNLWCPLVEPARTGEPDKGFVRIVPGSTHLPHGHWYRARGGHLPSGFEPAEVDAYERLARPVTMEFGDVLALDHRLVHCSPPNLSDEPRLVLAIGLRPAEALNIHVECDEDGFVDFYAVDDEYFIKHPNVEITDYPRIRRLRSQPASVSTLKDFNRLAELGSCRHVEPIQDPLPAPADTRTPPTAHSSGPIGAAYRRVSRDIHRLLAQGPASKHRAAVLRDPVLDHRLKRDGFVRVPLLTRESASELRDHFGQLHGWQGDGFTVDFWDPDITYRRSAAEAIAAATDGALQELFCDHEPFLRNFLVKWPGDRDPDGFPEAPHRDWMYTDEPNGVKSWVVWIALQDITSDNGQLKVVRGSQRIDDMLRGTGLSPEWLEHRQVWDGRMLSTPAACGEAIILDAAVVHGSHANFSDDPRVVAAVAMKPSGADMLHFQAVSESLANKYRIDADFFMTQQVEGLEAPLDYPIEGVEPIGAVEISPRVLRRRLDRQPLAVLDRIQDLAGRYRNT